VVTIEQSIDIDRPVQEVFAFLTPFENIPRWESGILEASQTSPGPLAVGARGRDVRQFLGRRTVTEYEVTACEAPTRFAVRSLSGPVSVRASYTLEPRGEGTRLRSRAELRLPGPVRLLAPLIRPIMQRRHANDLRSLRVLLERPASP
jgi:carbon monoxide dehydrogenase subunit G